MSNVDRVYSIQEIKFLLEPVAQKYKVSKVVLFGSYAREDADKNSDIDFMIEKGELIHYKDFYNFCSELEALYEKNVDIVTLQSLLDGSKRLYEAIKREGILVYG